LSKAFEAQKVRVQSSFPVFPYARRDHPRALVATRHLRSLSSSRHRGILDHGVGTMNSTPAVYVESLERG
jgi:hypothetical protein